MTPALKCPYCGQDRAGSAVTECPFCHGPLAEEYLLLVDEDGDPFPLCSLKCMDSWFEFLEAEDAEEDE